MDRRKEITDSMIEEMAKNNIPDNLYNREAFLRGVLSAWTEIEGVTLEKTMYLITIQSMISELHFHLYTRPAPSLN